MASTAEALLKIELQGAGDNPGTWHTPLNNAISQLIEGLAQCTTVAMGAGDVNLTDTQYVSNQARSAGYEFTGTLTANRTVTCPDRDKVYYLHDRTTHSSYTLTFKPTGGSGILLSAGYRYLVYCDGAGQCRIISQSDPSYVAVSGTDTYTATLERAPLAYYAGMFVAVKFTNACTGPATINFNALGAVSIKKDASSALAASDITAGMSAFLVYDGTNFIIFVPRIATTLGLTDGGEQSSNFNAVVNTKYYVNCISGNITATGPNSANQGDIIVLAKFGLYVLTFGLNGLKAYGSTSDLVSAAEGVSTLVYTGATRGWVEG